MGLGEGGREETHNDTRVAKPCGGESGLGVDLDLCANRRGTKGKPKMELNSHSKQESEVRMIERRNSFVSPDSGKKFSY